jgi:hypothetical protein
MIEGIMGAALGAVQGVTGIVGGMIGSGKRKREQRAAQKEYNMNKAAYQGLDTSNLYSNLQNTYEDLTVNQGEAEFMKQQQQQSQANIMSSMQGAAGGSGIAALAQAIANQGSMDAQAAAVSVGQQESSNQAATAQMAGTLQMAERQGAEDSRALVKDKTETLLGMSQGRLAAANKARANATSSIMKGVGGVVGAGAEIAKQLAAGAAA